MVKKGEVGPRMLVKQEQGILCLRFVFIKPEELLQGRVRMCRRVGIQQKFEVFQLEYCNQLNSVGDSVRINRMTMFY